MGPQGCDRPPGRCRCTLTLDEVGGAGRVEDGPAAVGGEELGDVQALALRPAPPAVGESRTAVTCDLLLAHGRDCNDTEAKGRTRREVGQGLAHVRSIEQHQRGSAGLSLRHTCQLTGAGVRGRQPLGALLVEPGERPIGRARKAAQRGEAVAAPLRGSAGAAHGDLRPARTRGGKQSG